MFRQIVELVQLAGKLDWDWLDGEIAPLYSDKGRPGSRLSISHLGVVHTRLSHDHGYAKYATKDSFCVGAGGKLIKVGFSARPNIP